MKPLELHLTVRQMQDLIGTSMQYHIFTPERKLIGSFVEKGCKPYPFKAVITWEGMEND